MSVMTCQFCGKRRSTYHLLAGALHVSGCRKCLHKIRHAFKRLVSHPRANSDFGRVGT